MTAAGWRASSSFVVLCLWLTAGTGQERLLVPDEHRRKAQELWDEAIAAKGGRERLGKVGSMALSRSIKYRKLLFLPVEERFEHLFVYPSKHWMWADQRGTVFGLNVETTDLDHNRWSFARPGYPTETRPAHSNLQWDIQRPQWYYLMETAWVKPQPIRSWTTKLGKREVDVVETILEGVPWARLAFFLDRETRLPVRVVQHSRGRPRPAQEEYGVVAQHDLSDYVQTSGIWVPQTDQITPFPHARNARTYKESLRFEFDVEYEDGFFERLPSVEAGPEAWRPKRSSSHPQPEQR